MSVAGIDWAFRYNAAKQMAYSKQAVAGQTVDERFYLYDGLDCIAELGPAGQVYREFMREGNIGGVVAEFIGDDPAAAQGDRYTANFYHYNLVAM